MGCAAIARPDARGIAHQSVGIVVRPPVCQRQRAIRVKYSYKRVRDYPSCGFTYPALRKIATKHTARTLQRMTVTARFTSAMYITLVQLVASAIALTSILPDERARSTYERIVVRRFRDAHGAYALAEIRTASDEDAHLDLQGGFRLPNEPRCEQGITSASGSYNNHVLDI